MRNVRGSSHTNPTAHNQQPDMEQELSKLKEGSLHRDMGIKPGQKIPVSKLKKEDAHAKKDGDVLMERKAAFALAARKWKHK